jgi:hypothetical protein
VHANLEPCRTSREKKLSGTTATFLSYSLTDREVVNAPVSAFAIHAMAADCVTMLSDQTLSHSILDPRLSLAGLDDGGRVCLVLRSAGAGAASLNALDDGHAVGVAVGDLAEDDVAAVEPRGDNGGDEELRAVGVGAGVGHGEEEGAFVGELEVLVGELFAVDGLAAGALCSHISI